jgi:hypothetical protein
MSVTVKWNGGLFVLQVRRATKTGLGRAAVFLHDRFQTAVGVGNKFRHVAKFNAAQRAKRRGQATGVVYENRHNADAGKPPFPRTGFGQSQIVWEFNGSETSPEYRVGVRKNARYMAFLDQGTRHILPRPWLLSTLQKNSRQVVLLIESGRDQIKGK